MRKPNQRITTFATALGLLLVPPQIAFAADLTVALFGGLTQEAMTKAVIEPFEEAYGLDVVSDSRDFGIGVVSAKIESGSNVWDVVTTEDIEVIQGCQEGLFEPIDWARISQADALVKNGKLECGLADNLYMLGLAYNADTVGEAPQSWMDFWDTEKWPGMRSMYKSPRDTLEIALIADGVPFSDVYDLLSTPAGVDRAFAKLDQIKDSIIWWDKPGVSRQMLASGETIMTATYLAGVRNMNLKENTNFGVVLSGVITHADYWAIVKGTPNLGAAYKFLDYFSHPEPQAALSNESAMSGPNPESIRLVNEDIVSVLAINPELRKQSLSSNPAFWIDHFAALNQRFNAWLAR